MFLCILFGFCYCYVNVQILGYTLIQKNCQCDDNMCCQLLSKSIRARLFKTNDVVSSRFVKFSEVNFSDMPIFFAEKM